MTEIRAFVGHSFNPDDDVVVGAFLKYFDQIQNLLPAFDWTHAQAAEPRELAQKVLSLIADRNVFIGICTRKERAVAPSKLQAPFISFGARLGGRADSFEWKTSDWVIQEIELAIGREMSLVLLLEDGCRKPGGLQGDVEFIPFDRAMPEKAFGKLLEMLRALSPSARLAGPAITEGPAEQSSEVPQPPTDTHDNVPDGTWNQERYGHEFLWKLLDDEEQAAGKIEAAYLATDEAKDPARGAEWAATTETWRLLSGRGGSLERVRELAADNVSNVVIVSKLAACLNKFGHHLEAAAKYQTAADAEPGEAESQRLRCYAAVQFVRAGRADLAAPLLDAQRARIRSRPHEELQLLNAMREIAGVIKDDDLEVEVMERIVQIRPEDYDVRFSLAYKHSERESNDLAFHHYLQIPLAQRTAITWNNLGVTFQQFVMPAKAVDAYETAAASGETLAMSNLGYKLMQAGFIKEAEEQFSKAMKIENFHRNIGEGIAVLRDVPDNEDEKQREALEKAKPKIEFYQRLGRAITETTIVQLGPLWQGPDCQLAVTITGDEFTAVGTYERTGNALGFALGSKPTRHRVEYQGRIVGARIDGFVKRTAEGEPSPSLLSLGFQDDRIRFCMVVDEAAGRISVAENPSSLSPRFSAITRVLAS